MPLLPQQEQARQLINTAQQALDQRDWATALDSAGRAILHWPHWREPFALIAQVCCLRGDAVMGQSYLQLALDHAPATPLTSDPVPSNPTLSDADLLQQRFAQWCRDGATASAATATDRGNLPSSLRLVAGGDVMLGRQMPGWVSLRGAADALSGIAATLAAADLSMVNLKTCISTEGDFLDKGGRQPFYYHAHPEMLAVLMQAGVRCLATGNNHAMDYGAAALAQQTDTLDACGFLHFGAGRDRFEAALPKYARVKGVTIAFISVETETPVMAAGDTTPGVHYVAIDQLAAIVAGSIAIARACADIVLVSPHWGENWRNAPSQAIEQTARQLIELGADAVLGHSAHILQGVALHQGRPIIYDMGTLLFDRVTQHNMKDSALFTLTWSSDGACALDIQPVKLSNARAKLALGKDFERICTTLSNLSQALDPTLIFEQRDAGLCLRAQPTPSPMRCPPGQPPTSYHSTQNPLSVPAAQHGSQSNLVYSAMPAIDSIWPEPLQVNPSLTILGARYAGPVRVGRGFVCEVYFRASAPPMPSRVEARISALSPDGTPAFSYTHPVAEGIHPPARWQPEQVICDRTVVRPVALAAPGSYKLCWSLVDMEGGQAMPVETANERLCFGQVHIGDLQVSESAPQGVAGVSTLQKLVRASANTLQPKVATMESEASPAKLATTDNPLLLDATAMANVTGGTWHNLPSDKLLTGFSLKRSYIAEGSAGNLFLPINVNALNEPFNEITLTAIRKAYELGAVAAMVPAVTPGLPSDWPVLRVNHLMSAIEQLGGYVRDHLFTGKRVLVSGTEGKTGFKNMLRHALAAQIPTHAVTNSSNYGSGILASFASIRQHDRIAIFEGSGGRLSEHSRTVIPHLFVLTEVGNEHLDLHGSQQGVIEAKAGIVTGLIDGGYGLLNADSLNYVAVRRAVQARRRVPLLLFGSAPGCNGRLLNQHFANNRWSISADIEGQQVQYDMPLLGEHIPLATVSVLLAAYYLGADVGQAAADLADYQPYETQGVLRRIAHRGGEFLCYDNASRASVLSYQSALRMAARLNPPTPQGKKVAVIGQMIFLGTESKKWHAELASWVVQAGFDRLILVGKHTNATYDHLPDQTKVVRRFADYDRRTSNQKELQALIDTVIEVCSPGDLLFVKGELDELGLALQARQISSASPAASVLQPTPPAKSPADSTKATITPLRAALPRPTPSPHDVSVQSDLQPLALSHLPLYRSAIDQTQRTVWQHYFPFMYLLGQTPGYKFLIGEDAGSVCVYMLEEKNGVPSMSLFVLPMPLHSAVLARCIERVKSFNRVARAHLFRVDAADIEMFRDRIDTRIVKTPEEFVYTPAIYSDLSGNKKRNLRRAIESVQQIETLEVLDYKIEHAHECEQVLAQWAALQREKYGGVRYGGFTRGCLRLYDQFPRRDLFGKVIRIDGKICSFGFAGEMRQGMGNLFITYSDLRVNGLNKFLYHSLLLQMGHLEFANASHAGDSPGLAFAKQALGPAYLHQPYQVYAG